MKNWKEGRKLINVICANCKTEFKKTESEFKRSEKNNKKHFCCRKCVAEFQKEKSVKYCRNCNNIINKNDNRNIFCSHSCSAEYNNKKRKGEKRKFSERGIENITNAIRLRLNIEINQNEYNKNPKLCRECNNSLSFKKRRYIFCSIECKRKYDKKNLTEYQKYYKECQFDFNLSDYPNEFDFNLIEKHGWYQAKNHGNNLNGISRDHMISIMYGYENNINPEIIKHPANCQLMRHNENSSKWKACSITSEELNSRIIEWDNKYVCIHW